MTHRMVGYRIGGRRWYPHWAHRFHVDFWFRSWQCECDCGCLMWAARSWTKNLVERKARKWKRKGHDITKHERRYGRNDDLWNTLFIIRNMED